MHHVGRFLSFVRTEAFNFRSTGSRQSRLYFFFYFFFDLYLYFYFFMRRIQSPDVNLTRGPPPRHTRPAGRARARPGRGEVSSPRPSPRPIPGIRARWTFDCTYGAKMDAIALLQEWVQEVGSYAEPALNERNTSISAGNIGAPESRLELEVAFESLDELERFWGSIDPEKHMAWGQKVKGVVLDGTPLWEVYRGVDPFGGGHRAPATSSAARPSAQASQDVLEIASWDDMDRYAGKNWAPPSRTQRSSWRGSLHRPSPPGINNNNNKSNNRVRAGGQSPGLTGKGIRWWSIPGTGCPSRLNDSHTLNAENFV